MRKRHRQHRLLPSASANAANLTCGMNILEIHRASRLQEEIRPLCNRNLCETLPWTLGCVVDTTSCVRHWEYTWVDRLKVRAYELHNTSSNSTTFSAVIFLSAFYKNVVPHDGPFSPKYVKKISPCVKQTSVVLDFKFSPCSECCIISFAWFLGAWILCSDVSENSVSSSQVV